MATRLGDAAIGRVVKIKYTHYTTTSLVDFLVVHQDDGTWVCMQSNGGYYPFNTTGWSTNGQYGESWIDSYLNSTALNNLDPAILSSILYTTVRCNEGQSSVIYISRKLFLLSASQIGVSSSTLSNAPDEGPKLSYFLEGYSSSANQRRIFQDGEAWWTRTPYITSQNPNVSPTLTCYVATDGTIAGSERQRQQALHFAFRLDPSLIIGNDGTLSRNSAPTIPSSLTVPSPLRSATPITIQ